MIIFRTKRSLCLICIMLLVLQLFAGVCYAGTAYFPGQISQSVSAAAGYEDDVRTAGVKASVFNETADQTREKTIYSPGDYETTQVLIEGLDGSIYLENCGTREILLKRLTELEKDENVAFYQPNFQYDGMVNTEADSAGSVSAQSTGTPVLYGAPEELQNLRNYQSALAESRRLSKDHPAAPADEYYRLQWGLHNDGSFRGFTQAVISVSGIDINAEYGWKHYRAKRPVTIALVDTGVDYTNAELSESMWTNANEVPDNGIDDDGNGFIDDVYGWNFYNGSNAVYKGVEDDHGTHCAGTMVAASNNTGITGIADYSNIRVMTVKALGGRDGIGTTLTVMRAINYAEANGAEICNLSLSTAVNDRLLYRAMQNSGMLFVVAAGNSDSISSPGSNIDQSAVYPASYNLDNMIVVANTDAAGQLHLTSNYGKESVDLAAPGTDILSTAAAGKMEFMTGTSMAAPMVSAAAAMVYSGSNRYTLDHVKYILLHSVRHVETLAAGTAFGGILDLGTAISWR